MRIGVLIKQVPDTWGERRLEAATGRADRGDGDQVIDEIDERALEVALTYRDAHKDTEIVTISMGPDGVKDALRRTLAIGADAAMHVVDDALAGSDAVATSAALAAAIGTDRFDLVIAGNISTDGRGGVVPAMIAERLGLAQLSSLDVVEITDDLVRGERTTEVGSQRLHANLPALVTVTERVPEARFPTFRNILSAKRKPLSAVTLVDLGIERPTVSSTVTKTQKRPGRTAGRIVEDDGTVAAQLVEFLAAERLI